VNGKTGLLVVGAAEVEYPIEGDSAINPSVLFPIIQPATEIAMNKKGAMNSVVQVRSS